MAAAAIRLAAAALAPPLQRQIWRGDQLAEAVERTVSSGHQALDLCLPGKGWPTGSLTELLTEQDGIGELRLLAPALAALTAEQQRHVMLIAPPYRPYAVALRAWGVVVERVIWVRAPQSQALWAAEQALKQDGMGAVLMWSKEARPEALRRLQVAAHDCRSLVFLIRPLAAAAQASAAPLRIACRVVLPDGARALNRRQWLQETGLTLDIVKRRGPPLAAPLHLKLPLKAAILPERVAREEGQERRVNHVVDRGDVADVVAGGREAGRPRERRERERV
jgi:protein ImuA